MQTDLIEHYTNQHTFNEIVVNLAKINVVWNKTN